MSGYIERITGNTGEKLLRELLGRLWRELTGRKTETGLAELMRGYSDFGERELFRSVWDSEPDGDEGGAGRLLAASFLGSMFLLSRSAILDEAVNNAQSRTFTSGGKKLSLRSIHAELLRQPKRGERELAVSAAKPAQEKLNTLLRKKLDAMTECAQALGFGDYGELAGETSGLARGNAAEEAKAFLADTEYASKDMLTWFLARRLDLKRPRAEEHDIAFLLNSGELKGNFPGRDMLSFSRPVLEASGLTPDGGITYDGERSPGKISDGFSLPLDPPSRTGMSIYPAGSVRDYEHFFGSLGRALSYMFTEREDYLEFRRLRDEAVESAFDSLFRGLLYEPRWLAKYLRIDEAGDFRKFLGLRRLMSARYLAGLSVYEADLFKNSETESMPGHYERTMSSSLHCRIDAGGYLRPLARLTRASSAFYGAASAPALSNYLRERFDEEWWRVPDSGEYLKGLWREGGRVTMRKLTEITDGEKPGTDPLKNYIGNLFD